MIGEAGGAEWPVPIPLYLVFSCSHAIRDTISGRVMSDVKEQRVHVHKSLKVAGRH